MGENPGLGTRALHAAGITGKGVNMAIIDQNLVGKHREFADRFRAYKDFGCGQPANVGSMHGPAVLSLLVGQTTGTAPGVRVYYAAAPSWTGDAALKRAEAAGLVVLDCSGNHGWIGPGYYDPGDPKMSPLSAPCSRRSSAEEYHEGQIDSYQYAGTGGLSRAIPYVAGVLAMGW